MALKIPYLYQEVEYIESTGTQYIDTGVPVKSTLVSRLKFNMTAVTGSVIYGSHTGDDKKDYRLFNYNNTCYLDLPGGSAAEGNRIYGGTMSAGVDYDAEIGNSYVKNLGTGSNIVSGAVVSFAEQSNTMKMWKGPAGCSSGKLYYLDIYDGTELVRSFIPCYRKSDGEVGLFDLVNQTFFTNLGTGVFEKGADAHTVDVVYPTFQSGIVGKTNVVEGAVIGDGMYNQLVNYVMLYDEGDECTAVTGGWKAHQYWKGYPNGYASKNESYLEYGDNSNNYGDGGFITANSFNLDEYSAIVSDIEMTSYYVTGSYGAGVMSAVCTNSSPDRATSGHVHHAFSISKTVARKFGVTDLTGNFVGAKWIGCYGSSAAYNNHTSVGRTHHIALAKADDWKILCEKAGITAPTDLATLIADTALIMDILNNRNAVKFMVKRCTGDFMASFVASSACLSLLDSSPYKTIVQANEHWAKFLAMVA